MASIRTSWASSGVISGSGFAMAKITGLSAMEATIAGVTAPQNILGRLHDAVNADGEGHAR